MHNATGVSRKGRNSQGQVVERPLSPHLQIYKPQISTVLSIFHRGTGIALSVGTLLLTWWLVASAGTLHQYAVMQHCVGSPIGLIALFGWTVALCYHLLAGLRHLVWDTGTGYSIPAMTRSGWAVVIGTVVLTGCVWAAGFSIWHQVRFS